MNNNPYVVSADVVGLMERWGRTGNFSVPSAAYMNDLMTDVVGGLSSVFGQKVEVDLAPEEELREGLDRLVSAETYPVVSLDRAYFENPHNGIFANIDVTRGVRQVVDHDGNVTHIDAGDLMPRPGFPSVSAQLAALSSSTESPITLVDDVIFSGVGAVDLVTRLKSVGRPVTRFIAGIAIGEGIKKLETEGVEVVCVRQYDDVVDEVCMRDFFAGIPMSGRTVFGENDTHWSAPYMAPYGNTEKWASIPTNRSIIFSRLCIAASMDLWKEVGKLSGRQVSSVEVPRLLRDASAQKSMVALLNQQFEIT